MKERLEQFRQFVNKQVSNSPSQVTNWLAGTPLVVDEDRLVMKYTVRRDMCNIMQMLHGGITATILDDMCGIISLLSGDDHFYSTVNLSIDYLSGAQVGDEITGEVHIVRKGRNIVNVEGWLRKNDGKLVAKCSSNLINTPVKVG